MNWISVKYRLPDKGKIFWAFMDGRLETGSPSPAQKDYSIKLLYMETCDEAISLNVGNYAYSFPQELDAAYTSYAGYIIAWLPFEDMPLPTIPEELL